MTGRGALALAALGTIAAVSAAWWALALWPLAAAAPEWVLRAREVCFGATRDALPDAGGWILLLGEPLGLAAVLVVVWGDALREGLAAVLARPAGRALLAGSGLALLLGLAAAGRLVAAARGEPFELRPAGDAAGVLAAGRIDDKAPALHLVDQHGDSVGLERFAGRPVLVTFAFGHCTTVCPVTVRAAGTAARRRAGRDAVLLVVTLDPWRDTQSRLAHLAGRWELGDGMYVLGGDVGAVEHTLSRWRVPRARNPATGDITHPSIIYVIGPDGRLAYALGPDPDALVAAIDAVTRTGAARSTPR